LIAAFQLLLPSISATDREEEGHGERTKGKTGAFCPGYKLAGAPAIRLRRSKYSIIEQSP